MGEMKPLQEICLKVTFHLSQT